MIYCLSGLLLSAQTGRRTERHQSWSGASASCVCAFLSPPDMFMPPWIPASCSLALALSLAMLHERSSSELGPSRLGHFPDLWVTASVHTLSAEPAAFVHRQPSASPWRLSQASTSQLCACCLKLRPASSGVSSLSVFAYGLASWPWSFSWRLILARRF